MMTFPSLCRGPGSHPPLPDVGAAVEDQAGRDSTSPVDVVRVRQDLARVRPVHFLLVRSPSPSGRRPILPLRAPADQAKEAVPATATSATADSAATARTRDGRSFHVFLKRLRFVLFLLAPLVLLLFDVFLGLVGALHFLELLLRLVLNIARPLHFHASLAAVVAFECDATPRHAMLERQSREEVREKKRNCARDEKRTPKSGCALFLRRLRRREGYCNKLFIHPSASSILTRVVGDPVDEVGHLSVDAGVAFEGAFVSPGHDPAENAVARQRSAGIALPEKP